MQTKPFHYLSELVKKFEAYCQEDFGNIIPCSKDDISLLEQRLSARVPAAYREFLGWMGRGGGQFLQRHYRYDLLPKINAEAQQFLMLKRPGLRLPDSALVFAVDLDESFYFVRSSEGDDPPVYIFMEAEQQYYMRNHPGSKNLGPEWGFLFDDQGNDFGMYTPAFSECLMTWLDIYIDAKQGLPDNE